MALNSVAGSSRYVGGSRYDGIMIDTPTWATTVRITHCLSGLVLPGIHTVHVSYGALAGEGQLNGGQSLTVSERFFVPPSYRGKRQPTRVYGIVEDLIDYRTHIMTEWEFN